MPELTLPHNWNPRPYQVPFAQAFQSGRQRRFYLVWPRRSGKDLTALNLAVPEMFKRVGTYFHMFPEFKQGRKALWDGLTSDGLPIIDTAFPPAIVDSKRDDEMRLRLINQSVFQVVGADNIDRVVGSNPIGVIFSEFALTRANAWSYIRPMLAANGGWAVFITTPRGYNHAHHLWGEVEKDPLWFTQLLTTDQTKHIPPEVLAQEAREMPEDLFRQEYFCSWSAGQVGAIYAGDMDKVPDHFTQRVPWEPLLPVHTFWDVGVEDDTTIIFAQRVRDECHIIDAYSDNNESILHYLKVLQSKPYNYGLHFAPHDAFAREMGTARSITEIAEEFGFPFERVPYLSVIDGINAGRTMIPRVWIDAEKGEPLIHALRGYSREYDEDNRVWSKKPKHDEHSHFADAYRYMALAWDMLVAGATLSKPRVVGTSAERRYGARRR